MGKHNLHTFASQWQLCRSFWRPNNTKKHKKNKGGSLSFFFFFPEYNGICKRRKKKGDLRLSHLFFWLFFVVFGVRVWKSCCDLPRSLELESRPKTSNT
jgi:hypothetical protein